MPLLETKGAASAQGFGGAGAGASGLVTYIEDVFSTWLYQGTSANQTITNGIDLSTKGGLVWCKGRPNPGYSHRLFDTARGVNNSIATDITAAQFTQTNSVTAFNTTGFSLGTDPNGEVNFSGSTYVGWTFRKQPKFFDIVTYTGTGANRTIAHNLGSVPGCIIVKRTDTTADWQVYHRSLANTEYMVLNTTAAKATGTTRWNSTTPTSTVFSLGTDTTVNANGGTYVAYLFAHNAGGFGAAGTDNVISCGSFIAGGVNGVNVELGFEPQWIMLVSSESGSNWTILDNMRGWTNGGTPDAVNDSLLSANTSAAESSAVRGYPYATGFNAINLGSSTYIYIAIRRGPMKVPTSGTSVFMPVTYAGNGGTQTISTGKTWPQDLLIGWDRTLGAFNAGVTSNSAPVLDRLRGFYTGSAGNAGPNLATYSTLEEASATNGIEINQQFNYVVNYTAGNLNASGSNYVDWLFRRAPGFFDEVCYTGTGSNTTQTHNLGVVPEMMIVKQRTAVTGATIWAVYHSTLGAGQAIRLNSNVGPITDNAYWNGTTPTASVFSLGNQQATNVSTGTYVAYLFATCAGVSKVGSYTGTGALQTINCGFTGGARFVLIKRTDSTGDWYVYDSARGISSGNDPYLLLNSTAAEVTGTNYVDTTSVGFQVTAAAPAGLNANGGTYIFLAIS